jgi:hypothetical protein
MSIVVCNKISPYFSQHNIGIYLRPNNVRKSPLIAIEFDKKYLNGEIWAPKLKIFDKKYLNGEILAPK